MTDRSSRASIGRNLLLSVTLGTLPLAGCATMFVDANEGAAYERAVAGKDAQSACNFMSAYPQSALVRNVLIALPPSALQRVSKCARETLPPETIAQLPVNIRTQLGIESAASSQPAAARAPRVRY